MIELPKNVAHLGAAVRQHRELLKLLKATGTRLGGGTVLAAHWGEHRRSTELDLMMKAAAFDEHQETIRQMLAEIPANEHSAIVDKTTKRRIVLAARGINGLTGDIEIVRDQLGDSMRTAQGTVEGPRVWDVAMNAEATVYILAKKLNRLERRDLERDHYDLLWAAYKDREALIQAAIRFSTPPRPYRQRRSERRPIRPSCSRTRRSKYSIRRHRDGKRCSQRCGRRSTPSPRSQEEHG